MKIGIMFGYELVITLWILMVAVSDARHVPLARQQNSAQSRPRLLIIRPPEGSGQPSRIVVLAPPRPQPTNPSPAPLSTAMTALRETAAVAQASLDRAFGGHPQSAFRQQASSSSSSSSTSRASSGTHSLRNLIQAMRNNIPSTTSNIARISNTIPRAMPPMLPPATRFGELNIPSVIEAALRRLRERTRNQANVRDRNVLPRRRHSFQATTAPAAPLPTHRSPFSGGVLDLSRVSLHERNNRGELIAGDRSKRPRGSSNPRWAFGTVLPPSTLGRNGVSPVPRSWNLNSSRRNPNSFRQGHNTIGQFLKNNDLLQMPTETRTNQPTSAGRSFLDRAKGTASRSPGARSAGSASTSIRDMRIPMPGAFQSNPSSNNVGVHHGHVRHRLNSFAPGRGKGSHSSPFNSFPFSGRSSSALSKLDTSIPTPSRVDQFRASASRPAVSSSVSIPAMNPLQFVSASVNTSLPIAAVSLNSSAKLSTSSAEANSTSNTTSTKSVKTKTIKVTTTVKGGSKASVPAVVANQAGIANAIAQGKQIDSSTLNGLAIAASDVVKSNGRPSAGSITVKRQPNGVSIITLSDGQGEPVVLRATGPVKIERIIKPNGRIQFLINPMRPRIDPAAEQEIEPEDLITTTYSPPASINLGFSNPTWATSAPFISAPFITGGASVQGLNTALSGTAKAIDNGPVNTGPTRIEKTIQITDTAVTDTASVAASASVKNKTASASVESHGLMQLFQPQKIPPPPKISNRKIRNSGVINPFVTDTNTFIDSRVKNAPPPSDKSLMNGVYGTTTNKPYVHTGRNISPLSLFQSDNLSKHQQQQQRHQPVITSASDTMPHYQLLGVSPPLNILSQGKAVH